MYVVEYRRRRTGDPFSRFHWNSKGSYKSLKRSWVLHRCGDNLRFKSGGIVQLLDVGKCSNVLLDESWHSEEEVSLDDFLEEGLLVGVYTVRFVGWCLHRKKTPSWCLHQQVLCISENVTVWRQLKSSTTYLQSQMVHMVWWLLVKLEQLQSDREEELFKSSDYMKSDMGLSRILDCLHMSVCSETHGPLHKTYCHRVSF